MRAKKMNWALLAGFVCVASALGSLRSGQWAEGSTCALLPQVGRCQPASRRAQAATLALPALSARAAAQDLRLAPAYRFDRGGWIYVHLAGSPAAIGYQHGHLLAPEIADALNAVRAFDTHQTGRPWEFFRAAARDMLWPHIDAEYQAELKGILQGLTDCGIKMDLWDLVALNAFCELADYYVPWYNQQHRVVGAPRITPEGRCSAFVATGRWTRDRDIVMAHNNWSNFIEGERWRIIFDIAPARGHHILMDGFPGVITSDDDFGINSGGLMVTETTITQFHGWDPDGKPEFARSRKALQYASSIDDYVRIMLDGNNGGYANDWLLGDRKTGEIARFELGLRDHRVWHTEDGYFVGSNFSSDPRLTAGETTFDPDNRETSPNARHIRWDELMKQYKGRIDVSLAEQFESDHYDTYSHTDQPDERTLCGHTESSPRGAQVFNDPPYNPSGAVQGKVVDSQMAAAMAFMTRRGHPCGTDFLAAPFLKAHPEYSWMAPVLEDMKAGPWTEFHSDERP